MSDTAVLRIRVESSGISAASSDLQRLSAQGGATENSLLRLKNIVFAVGAAMGVDTVIRYSDAWTTVTNKLANVRKESESLADVQSRVFSIAQNSNSSLEATATLYSRLEPATKKLVKSGEELGGITETINKAMIVSGATTAEATGSLIQLSQGLGAGALRGEEFNSVNEAAPRLMQAIADSLGVTRGELRGYAAQGQLTSEVIINAMREQSAAIDSEFSKMNATFEQKGVKAYNNMVRSIGENNDLASATSAAGDALLGLSENVDTVVAAGEIMAAVYGAKLVGSLATATQSKIATAIASRSLAMGEVQAAQAAVAQTVAEKANAIAAQQSLVSQLALAQTEKTRTAIRLLLAENSAVVTAAVNAETAATERLTVAQAAANTTARVGAGALALIGGPAGAAMLAGTALYFLYDAYTDGKQASIDFTDGVDVSTEALKKMTPAALEAASAKLYDSIVDQTDAMDDQENKVQSLQNELNKYSYWTEKQKADSSAFAKLQRELAIETGNLEEKQTTLNNSNFKLETITRALNGVIGQSVGVLKEDGNAADIATGIHRELNRVLGIQLDTKKQLYVLTEKPSISTAAMKDIKAMQQQNELLKAQGVEKAKLEARQKGQAKGYTEIDIQGMEREAAEGYNIEQSQKAAAKATQDKEAADRKAASAVQQLQAQVESNNDKVSESKLRTEQLTVEYNNLLNGTDSITGATSRYTIESARLAAQQQLNTKATGDQVEALARELLAQDKINESIQKGRQIRKDLKEFTQTTSEFKADATVDVNNPLSSEDAEHQKRLAKIDAFSLTEAAKTKEGQRLITTSYVAEMQRRENAVAAIQKQTALDSLSTIGSSMSGITSMLQSAGQEQTAVYKAMFFAQKAIAIPSMIVSTMDAANKALDVGGPFGGPGMAAAITAMGYANVGIAAGQAIAGAFDTGGYIPTGAYGVVSEKGDELVNGTLVKGPANVISRKDTAAMLNNESSGGNVVQMTVHQTIQVTGNGDANLVAAMQQAANQGAQMAYQAVATDFKDNKGIRRLIS